MTEKNNKVPIAILSCFLIAFILQGVLKLSGILAFEKALDWEIFSVIDKNLYANIVYQIFINVIKVYCLSFVLTPRPYSKKWYSYVIIILTSVGVILPRMLIQSPMYMQFVYDVLLYIVAPTIIGIIENHKNTYTNNIKIIPRIACHIMLYFCYLGLGYWSGLVCSLYPEYQLMLSSSKMFLINFEVYIALVMITLIPRQIKK